MNVDNFLEFKELVNYLDSIGNSMIMNAVSKNDIATVEKLIKLEADLNIVNIYDLNILVYANSLEDKYLIDTLLPQYKDKFTQENKNIFLKALNEKDLKKYSALYSLSNNDLRLVKAVQEEYFDEIKELLKSGANPNAKDEQADHILHSLAYKKISKKIKILNSFKGYKIDFLQKDKYNYPLISSIAGNRQSSNKCLMYIIKHFEEFDFTKNKTMQELFHQFIHSEEEYQTHFIDKINKKNYQSIDLTILVENKLNSCFTIEKIFQKFIDNGWSIDYKIKENPAITYLLAHHKKFSTTLKLFQNQIDINQEYKKGEILYFDCIDAFAPFDQQKIDLTKKDKEGNNALMHLFASHDKHILDKYYDANDTAYARDLFDYFIHHKEIDIYYQNKKGESILSQLTHCLSPNYIYRVDPSQHSALSSTLIQVLKEKGYNSNFKVGDKTLEEALNGILAKEDIADIEKHQMEKMMNNKNPTLAKKIKI